MTEADELIVSTADGTTDAQRTRSFSADVGDAETVSILLVDAGDDGVATSALPAIAIDGGTVTFEQDEEAGEADLLDETLITRVRTGEGDNQVTVSSTASATAQDISVVDGVVEFNLLADEADDFAVVPVVVAGDRDDLPVNAAGEPTIDFGVGGATFFINPADVELTAALSGDADGDEFDAAAPFGGEVTATFTLFANAGEASEFIVPSAGEELTAFAVRGEEGDDNPAEGFAPFADTPVLDIPASSELIVDGATLTIGDDNTVSFTWDGPDKPGVAPEDETIVDALFVGWEGSGPLAAGSSELEDEKITWNDVAAVFGEVSYTLAGEDIDGDETGVDAVTRIVGTNVQLVVTVVDQFGRPWADQDVTIDYDGVDIDRTTNASGQASANLSSPDETELNEVKVDVDAEETFEIAWYEVAGEDEWEIEDADLLSINTDGGYVVVQTNEGEGEEEFYGVVYTGADFFELEGDELDPAAPDQRFVTQAAWVSQVELQLAKDERPDTLEITTDEFGNDDEDSTITLNADGA